jgi:predicted glycoside hydrolase/deacetylase ChbG (UPF0249 family)
VGRLILNADDFGLTAGVNRAIVELHQTGVLTSATLMARAPATDEAIELALSTPSLGIGCHVVLVDGEPVLSPRSLPTLTDPRTGRFQPTPGAFLRRLLTGRIRSSEIEAETAAQIALLQSRGLRLTHIDTHKHAHIFPAVLRPVLRAARAAGLRSVRNPFEPVWSLRATPAAPPLRRAQLRLLRLLEPAFRRIVAEEGFTTTDGAIGLLATGTLSAAALTSLLRNLPPGTWELVTHPGYNDADLARAHTRLLASRDTERQALSALQPLPGINLISFLAGRLACVALKHRPKPQPPPESLHQGNALLRCAARGPQQNLLPASPCLPRQRASLGHNGNALLRSVRAVGQVGNRQPRRRRGQHGARRSHAVQQPKNLQLRLQLIRHAVNHQVGVADRVLDGRDIGDVREGF